MQPGCRLGLIRTPFLYSANAIMSCPEFECFEDLARDHHLAALPGAAGSLLGLGRLDLISVYVTISRFPQITHSVNPFLSRTSSHRFRQRLVAVARNPEASFARTCLPEAVSGAAAAPLGAVGGAIASAARILVASRETTSRNDSEVVVAKKPGSRR